MLAIPPVLAMPAMPAMLVNVRMAYEGVAVSVIPTPVASRRTSIQL